jgi:hypothetical protein
LDSRKWKDLNKINNEEKWWCGMFEKLENLTSLCIKNYNNYFYKKRKKI